MITESLVTHESITINVKVDECSTFSPCMEIHVFYCKY